MPTTRLRLPVGSAAALAAACALSILGALAAGCQGLVAFDQTLIGPDPNNPSLTPFDDVDERTRCAGDELPEASSAACALSCEIEVESGQVQSSQVQSGGRGCGQRLRFGEPSEGAVSLDMRGFGQVEVTLTACDPRSFVFHLADSPSNDGGGGDGGDSSHDAELHIVGHELAVFLAGSARNDRAYILSDYLDEEGCTTKTLTLGDGVVQLSSGSSLCSPQLLRIDPPDDEEGSPDALWYLGLNRAVREGSTERGEGLRSVELCFR